MNPMQEMTLPQRLWILTAHPDTLALETEDAPDWLVAQCSRAGLATWLADHRQWRLTEKGYEARRRLIAG